MLLIKNVGIEGDHVVKTAGKDGADDAGLIFDVDQESSFGIKFQPCKCKGSSASKPEIAYSFYVGIVPVERKEDPPENLLCGEYLFGSGHARFLTCRVKPSRQGLDGDVINQISPIIYNKNGANLTCYPDTEIKMMYKQGKETGASNQRENGVLTFQIGENSYENVTNPPGDCCWRPFILLITSHSKLYLPSLHLSRKRRCADWNWSVSKRIFRSKEFTDAIIVSKDGSNFPVHRHQLSGASPVFSAIFRHGLSESLSQKMIIDASKDAVDLMLRFVYTGELKNCNNVALLEEVGFLADKYQLFELERQVKENLIFVQENNSELRRLSPERYQWITLFPENSFSDLRNSKKMNPSAGVECDDVEEVVIHALDFSSEEVEAIPMPDASYRTAQSGKY